ncbi:Uncharacterized conserved secreted protein [Parvularcula bermudensis HTCC2503]|uniref:Uncharacterized conserved secreted protein n=1 Tax=Parvularcula bermudensis (strain ATCC BAA-594 / HTCC2503 / KCTC 12087) TaxID=314260 RepID=E0TBW5_PARBH|nr:DUF3034 family protein [Parvularcula bermudensis]ADM08458.1 Uncharacterized conserved secreted protein [Parvularcula bermudensis HTCC2503]
MIRFMFMAALATMIVSPPAAAQWAPDRGRLLMTGGVSQIEGQGGSGLVPWALITGYGSELSWGASAFVTDVQLSDFSISSHGLAVGVRNRLELSYARQAFDTEELGGALGLGEGFEFDQEVFGAKLRLAGDVVTDQDTWLPQISVGIQVKKNKDGDIVRAVGADDDEGVDYYLSATKLLLAQSLLLGGTIRSTEANQLGFLGFSSTRTIQVEATAAALLTKRLALGGEVRTKPDNLAFAEEEDAATAYLAYFPSKYLSLTAAYADLGTIAGLDDQTGSYLSVQGSF